MANEVVRWEIEKRVIFASMEDEQTRPQFEAMNEEIFRLLDEAQPPVHLIVDVSKLVKPYVDVTMVSKKTIAQDKRVGKIFVVGAKGAAQFMINVVGTLIKSKVQNVPTLEAARKLLQEMDSSSQ